MEGAALLPWRGSQSRAGDPRCSATSSASEQAGSALVLTTLSFHECPLPTLVGLQAGGKGTPPLGLSLTVAVPEAPSAHVLVPMAPVTCPAWPGRELGSMLLGWAEGQPAPKGILA